MPKISHLRNYGKTVTTPRRPFEKERLDAELQTIGTYGLKNKREVWRLRLVLAKVRSVARELLKLDDKNERRLFEGQALMRRLHRLGVLEESKNQLDYVLQLKIEDFMERRLQTIVWRKGLAKSPHHARCLIKQRHIRVRSQMVDVPSFLVRVDSYPHIAYTTTSTFGGGRPGRCKRKKLKAKAGEGGEAAEGEEEV